MVVSPLFQLMTRLLLSGVWVILFGLFLWFPSLSNFWRTERVINLLSWTSSIDPYILSQFEKETGIKVNISYFESNEELFVKLYTTKGKGYDLIMPSDYIVQKLVRYDLIKPLERSKITIWDRIDPRALNQYYDPGNRYSIPYYWAVYGVGFDTDYFEKTPDPSWNLLFNPKLVENKVGMLNVAREAMLVTAQYLFGTIDGLSYEQLQKVKETLMTQKPHVEAYIDTDVRSDYMLISKVSPAVPAATPYIAKVMQEYDYIDFLVPKEGTFMLIDNLALPAGSLHDELVYEFINFLYRPDIVQYLFSNLPFIPVTKELRDLMQEDAMPEAIVNAHFADTAQVQFFKDIIPETVANEVWFALKTS